MYLSSLSPQIATDCIQSNLLKYAAKDYFFKVGSF